MFLKNNFLSFSVTNIFIFLSFVWFILNFLWFSEYIFNLQYDFKIIFLFFISTFFHWDIFHFLFNSIFLVYFWNILEKNLWKNKYIFFFIFTVLFEWFLIKYFSSYYNVIWISWFCMAVLAYYTLDLKDKRNPEYKTWFIFLFINIAYGIAPSVSFYGHLFWAVAWVVFYYLDKEFFRKKMVWAFAA